MNQDDLGATAAPASADFLLAKRRRGRPRKDENLLNSDNASGVGRVRRRRRKADSAYSDNAMVGQIVSGVLDGSIDSGYLLTVRVGDTRTVLRGMVFEPGRSVPITATNDVAPHVKMFQRAEVAIPTNEQCNLTPASIHMLQPVFKSNRSSRRLHKSDPSHQHRISPSDVGKEQAAQTEKWSDELSQKQSSPLAEKALVNDSCKPLLATAQSLDVDIKAMHTVDTSKNNEATLPEGKLHENGQAPLTVSASKNGSSSEKAVTHNIELAQLKQPHNDVKEASDSIELAQVKRSLNDGNEVPALTPQTLLSKVKTEDVQDTPKEFTVPLPMELPCDANAASISLKTDIKMEKFDSEPQDAITFLKNEDAPSQHEATKESSIQWAKETILALGEPDAEDKEVVSQALDIKSDKKQPLLQIDPEFKGAISMDVLRDAVHASFSEAKADKLVDAIKFGDDCPLPETESVSQSGVETLCGTLQNAHPAAGTDQLAEIGIFKDEKFADVPVVKSISGPNQSAPIVPEESLMPDVETAGQAVASNDGDDIDDPQGIQFIAVDKPVVVAEEPLLPDVEATSNHGNEIVDPQGLQFMAVDKPVVVAGEPLLPDVEAAEEPLLTDVEATSNHGNEIVVPQGLQFMAVDKPVVVAEEPLLPDVEATGNHGNEIVDPQGLQFMSVDKPEPLLPDLETAGGAVASNQGNEFDHANPSQVLQDSDNPTNFPVEKPPLSQDGVLSDDAVILEASNNENFGGWEEVTVDSCQPRE